MELDILTLDEASDILGCSAQTVRRKIFDGTLPLAKRLPGPNGLYLVWRADVEKLLDSKTA